MELDIEVHLQVWKELKPHLIGGDVIAAAEDFIQVLLEHGIDANEVMKYAVDNDLKSVLREFADDEHFDEEENEWHEYESEDNGQ